MYYIPLYTAYGISGNNQYYDKSTSHNKINTNHFHAATNVDLLLDVDNGKLNLCEVGNRSDTKEAKLWNLPIGNHGWLPHFNIFGAQIQLRLAKIPVLWYGVQKSNIFE